MKTIKTLKIAAATALIIAGCFSFYKVLDSLEIRNYTAVVLEKAYVPSSTSVSGSYSTGELHPSYDSERFILVVKAEDGNVSSIDVTADQYGNATVNEPIELQCVVFKRKPQEP